MARTYRRNVPCCFNDIHHCLGTRPHASSSRLTPHVLTPRLRAQCPPPLPPLAAGWLARTYRRDSILRVMSCLALAAAAATSAALLLDAQRYGAYKYPLLCGGLALWGVAQVGLGGGVVPVTGSCT